MHVHSFDPIVDSTSRVLVLGSMPGRASLLAGEYYAHPRNLFWPLMEDLLGVEREQRYARRAAALLARGVALWDVLETCTRGSSLDSDIVESSIVANDLPGLLERHPSIRTLCFNGLRAANAFRRHVQPKLAAPDMLALHVLPSTSPANASIPYPRKREAWRVVARSAQAVRPWR